MANDRQILKIFLKHLHEKFKSNKIKTELFKHKKGYIYLPCPTAIRLHISASIKTYMSLSDVKKCVIIPCADAMYNEIIKDKTLYNKKYSYMFFPFMPDTGLNYKNITARLLVEDYPEDEEKVYCFYVMFKKKSAVKRSKKEGKKIKPI